MFFFPLLVLFPSLVLGNPLPPLSFRQLASISNPFIALPAAVLLFKRISPGILQGSETRQTYEEKERWPDMTFIKSVDSDLIQSLHLKKKSRVSWRLSSQQEEAVFDNARIMKESSWDQKRMVSRLGKRSSSKSKFSTRKLKLRSSSGNCCNDVAIARFARVVR